MAVFTKDDIQRARQTDIIAYLQKQNEVALQAGGSEPYQMEPYGKKPGEYKVLDQGGLIVTGNMWSHMSRTELKGDKVVRLGGNTLDFLTKYEGKSFNDAMEILTGKEATYERAEVKTVIEKKDKSDFELPEKNDSFRRVMAYLTKTRALDSEIVLSQVKKGNIFEDKTHHNAVFVGRDTEGDPRWAQKRSTLSDKKLVLDQTSSDPNYPFTIGDTKSKYVIVTEAPIESLSIASLVKREGGDPYKNAILAIGGAHDVGLEQYLKDHPQCKNICFALNNDNQGRESTNIYKEKYEAKGYNIQVAIPKNQDWNDDLKTLRQRQLLLLEFESFETELHKMREVIGTQINNTPYTEQTAGVHESLKNQLHEVNTAITSVGGLKDQIKGEPLTTPAEQLNATKLDSLGKIREIVNNVVSLDYREVKKNPVELRKSNGPDKVLSLEEQLSLYKKQKKARDLSKQQSKGMERARAR
jgi:hypothetical protein